MPQNNSCVKFDGLTSFLLSYVMFHVHDFRYVTMIPEMEDYSGVKTFRVLRALKTISTVKGTKLQISTFKIH